MRKLSALLPAVRWIPHDIEHSSSSSKKDRDRPKRSILSRNSIAPDHGSLRRRKSAVSISSAADDELCARTHMQGQSAFFAKLPLEIRRIVYSYVSGEETIHLLFAKKRFGHFICEDDNGAHGECGCKVMVGGSRCARLSSACARILIVCRRMYTEAAPLIYAPHTFSLLNITHLLYLPSRVPQPRLDTIRTLRLKWTIRGMPYFRRQRASKYPAYPEDTANWEKGWAILARMKMLRDLRVFVVDPTVDGIWEHHWLGVEEILLEAVKMVRTPRKFELVLPYEGCSVDWDMGGCNVKLVRPGMRDQGEPADG